MSIVNNRNTITYHMLSKHTITIKAKLYLKTFSVNYASLDVVLLTSFVFFLSYNHIVKHQLIKVLNYILISKY